MDHLKYPIGKHEVLQTFDQASIDESIETLQKAPVLLKEAIQGLKKSSYLPLSRRGMDRLASSKPSSRQPYERLCSL